MYNLCNAKRTPKTTILLTGRPKVTEFTNNWLLLKSERQREEGRGVGTEEEENLLSADC